MKYICSLIVVEDINKSRKFYEEIMEQKVENDYGENVVFNGFAIHLKSHFKNLIKNKEIKENAHHFELYFEHNDLENFIEKLKKNNVEFIHELEMQSWGQKVIRIYDLDNNIIEIGEPI
jgi:extradiol dioxygenase family protein